jgi:hypothetical protein
MTQFTPERFLEAHRIAFSHFEATRNNIRILRDGRNVVASAAQFALIDTKALLRQLSYQAPDGTHYCVLGEITRSAQFSPSTLEYMYELNARILLVNTALTALKSLERNRRPLRRIARLFSGRKGQPPLTAKEISALLASQLDVVLLGTRAVAETLWYRSKVSNQPLVMRRIIGMAGYQHHQPLSLQEAAEADRIITALIEQYKARRGRATGEILTAALNADALAGDVEQMHAGWIPMWMDQVDQEGAKIVNDVWLPPYYAQRILQDEGQGAAHELAA